MEQGNDIPSVIEEVFKCYTDGSYIKASMLPDLDLYVDQITTFLTRHLAKTIRFEDDKIMTKTMINNYTKNHLLPPPDKKKYSRDHILLMIFIYYFKNILSISDIQRILNPITDKYFGTDKESSVGMTDIYSEVFSLESEETKNLLKDLARKYSISQKTFLDCEDLSEKDREFLQTFAFICELSFDVYIKKTLIEKIIDSLPQEDKKESKKDAKKEAKKTKK